MPDGSLPCSRVHTARLTPPGRWPLLPTAEGALCALTRAAGVLDADAVLILRGVDFSDAAQQRAVLALVAAVEAEEHCLVPYASFLRDYLVYAAQHGLAPSGPRFYG